MEFSKRKISPEKMEELTKQMLEVANKGVQESEEEIQDAMITTRYLKHITKVRDLADVIERNEQLSKTFRGFLNLYGFESMYDMYLYARSCDIMPEDLEKSKASQVVPVNRKVMRNGEEIEITIYESVSKSEEPKEKTLEQENQRRHARELKGLLKGKDKNLDTKYVAMLKSVSLPHGDKPFQETSQYYLELKGESGELEGLIGYSVEDDYLKMDFYRSNGQLNGVATRGFSELVKLATEIKKGVKAEDQVQARPVYTQFGLEQHGDYWTVSYESLPDFNGKGSKNGE
ncbi:hypothetical protein 010DV004_229 [Bacillus phage 010DV004]|nr:hypothetical protein 010DV004_229 [Bacillus phage 010DV004]QZA69441.1 hypothetical protein 010DV005_229 [Bacillus phage 010DV005]